MKPPVPHIIAHSDGEETGNGTGTILVVFLLVTAVIIIGYFVTKNNSEKTD